MKWYISEEALWEVNALHEYVDALALHDMRAECPLYAAAAVGANAADWAAFLSSPHGPTTTLSAMPMHWGAICDAAAGRSPGCGAYLTISKGG